MQCLGPLKVFSFLLEVVVISYTLSVTRACTVIVLYSTADMTKELLFTLMLYLKAVLKNAFAFCFPNKYCQDFLQLSVPNRNSFSALTYISLDTGYSQMLVILCSVEAWTQ